MDQILIEDDEAMHPVALEKPTQKDVEKYLINQNAFLNLKYEQPHQIMNLPPSEVPG